MCWLLPYREHWERLANIIPTTWLPDSLHDDVYYQVLREHAGLMLGLQVQRTLHRGERDLENICIIYSQSSVYLTDK